MKSSKPKKGEVHDAGSQAIGIRGWSDLEGEAGRKECEGYLATNPDLRREGWKVLKLQGTWVVGR